MSFLSSGEIAALLTTYGYWAIALIIGLESMGIPLPGETTLIAAALIAGTTDALDIERVIAAAAVAAIVGDNIGFWIGRKFGFRLLLRFGPDLGLSQRRLKLGQYLFLRHGGKVVFFGRFVALLRVLAAALAGANGMRWGPFLLCNAAGAVVWASFFGLLVYDLGARAAELGNEIGIALAVVAGLSLVAGYRILRRKEAELAARAEAALPGPLRPDPVLDLAAAPSAAD